MLALKGIHRTGHSQVGLAGTGGADAEIDIVTQDRLDVLLLIQAFWANHAFLGTQGHAGFSYGVVSQVFHSRFLQI